MKKLLLTLVFLFTTLSAEEAVTVPTFTLTTVDQEEIVVSETKEGLNFEAFKGKAVLIALFGHRCPPCLKEIPEFIALTDKHPNDLEIVAIESQNYPEEDVKEFKSEHKMNYNVIAGINHQEFLSYVTQRAGYTNGIPLPLLIAINKNGEVDHVQAGLIREDELELLVKDLNE